MIEGLVFDLEGTVIDVEALHHQGHRDTAKHFGLELTLDECLILIPHFIGGPDEKIAEEIAALVYKKLNIVVDSHEILNKTQEYYEILLKNADIKPRDGFTDFLYEVKKMGYPVCIGTLTDKTKANHLLSKSHLLELFGDYVVYKEDVKNLKPDPEVWIKTAAKINIKPENQLIFEDSPRGIMGAEKISAYSVAMPPKYYDNPDVISALTKAGAKKIFKSWKDINVKELLDAINKEHHMIKNS